MRTVWRGSSFAVGNDDDGGSFGGGSEEEDIGDEGLADETGGTLNSEEGEDTKSANVGPALRASLNLVGCRRVR